MLTECQAETVLKKPEVYRVGIEHDARKEARSIARHIQYHKNIYKDKNISKHKLEKALKDYFDERTAFLTETMRHLDDDEKQLFWSCFNQECRILKSKAQEQELIEQKDKKF